MTTEFQLHRLEKQFSPRWDVFEFGASLHREAEAKFLRYSFYYEGAFYFMEPDEFSSISLLSKIEFRARI